MPDIITAKGRFHEDLKYFPYISQVNVDLIYFLDDSSHAAHPRDYIEMTHNDDLIWASLVKPFEKHLYLQPLTSL